MLTGRPAIWVAIKQQQLDDIKRLAKTAGDKVHYQLADLEIALPIASPGKILCLGLEYMDHVAEGPFEKAAISSNFVRTTYITGSR